MATERAPQPFPSTVRPALVTAAAGAFTWPLVLLARTAPWTSSVGATVASSTLPILLVLVAVGHGAASLRARWAWRGMAALGVLAAIVLVAGVTFAAAAGTRWPEPLGHSFAPAGTSVALVLVAAGGALVAGWFVPVLAVRCSGLVGRFPRPAMGVAVVVVVGVATRVARGQASAALLVALGLAVLVGSAVTASGGARSAVSGHGSALTLGGAVAGIVAFAPTCAAVLARQTPERTYKTGRVVHVLGPLVPLAMWTGLFAASLGVVLVVAGAGLAALASRRLTIPALRSCYGALVAALLCGGFALRVVALVTVNNASRDQGDPFFYHVTANLLSHGRGFLEPLTWSTGGGRLASALHGPAFPAGLSVWSRLGGTGYFDHQMASIVLGVPQVLAVVVLARLIAGRRVAVLAGALAVVYPNMWITDGSLFVEGLMAVFTTVATWCAYRYRAAPGWRWAAGLGALIGLAALTRGEAVMLVVLLLVPLVLFTRALAPKARWRHLIVGVVAFGVTLAPWMVYNAGRFKVFVPLSTNSNEVLFYANCDDVYSGPTIGFWSFACQTRYREEHGEAPGDQAQQSVFWRKLGVRYMKDHLSQLPKVLAARVGRQWELFRPWQTPGFAFIEGRPRRWVAFGQDMYYGMMVLAVPGTLALRRRRMPSWPLWTHAVAVTLTAAYAYGTLRFRAPFEPILCVLAAIGAIWVFDHARARLIARTAGGDVALAH